MPAKGARLDETEHEFAGLFEHCRAGSNHFCTGNFTGGQPAVFKSPWLAKQADPGTFWAASRVFLMTLQYTRSRQCQAGIWLPEHGE